MTPAVIPSPMTNWQKWAIDGGALPDSFLVDLLDYNGHTSPPEDMFWRRLLVRFSNTVSSDPRDDYWCSWDFANLTAGSLDTTWITSDYTTIETAFDTMFGSIKAFMNNAITIDQYKWYVRSFTPVGSSKPFEDHGPPIRLTTKTIVGTGTGYQAPQVACAITEKTAWPKHWGRWYMPGIIPSMVQAGGLYSSGNLNTLLGAVQTAYASCGSAELFPVVAVTQVDKAPMKVLLGIQSLQADDSPDVIRRRRPYSPSTRVIKP